MDTMAPCSLGKKDCFLPAGLSLKRLEFGFWLFLLVLCNRFLFGGQMSARYVFVPELVMNGQWYRAVLSPFTHVSCYHLILDAAAFLLLWNGLERMPWSGRWACLGGCWAGSLAMPLVWSSQIYERGLCGLSGIAHGLFAVTALEMLMDRDSKQSRVLGGVLFAGLLAKISLEIASGGGVMSNLHFGNVGVPIVTSHLGGLVGGSVVYCILHILWRRKRWL